MTPDHVATELQTLLRSRVGAFFSNTSREPGRCAVCTAPAVAGLCRICAAQRAAYGSQLADLVVPLAYVRGWMTPTHQSEHHVWRYKHPVQPSPRCLDDLRLMTRACVVLHDACIARAVGRRQVVTFVPSLSRPGPDHPVAELARQVVGGTQRIRLTPGPGIGVEPSRSPRADRFVVAPECRSVIAGRHVLVVDDAWVSGSKATRPRSP